MFFHQFKRIVILCTMLVFLGFNHYCLANTVQTELSSDHASLDETVTLSYVTNDNNNHGSPDFSVLQKDFRIISTNYGDSIRMINGVTSVQTFWRLQLIPKKTGELWIPVINFGSDQSSPRKLIVTASPNTQTTQNANSTTKQLAPVFVRSEISSNTAYVESQLIYTFKIFYRAQLNNPGIQFPTIKDVTFLQLSDSPEYQTTINGYVYNVIEKRFAVFPKKPGKIIIPAMQFHAYVLFDNINSYNNPFIFNAPKPIAASTSEIILSIRDIPANYQGNTWLPAKNISLSETWSDHSSTWETGTPVTRTIKITAQGLRGDQLPDLTFEKISGVNVYTDQPKRSNSTQNNLIIGVLEQKVTYIPSKTTSFAIPSIKINWWNTDTNANAAAKLDGISIHVKSMIAGAVSPTNNNVTQTLAAANATSSMTLPTLSNVFTTSIWFWIACAFFSAWLVTLWFMLRKKSAIADVVQVQSQSQQTIEISEKEFKRACHAGQALQAQQYLLAWAKKHWPDAQLNLTTLRQFIINEPFDAAIQELEQVIYAKKSKKWHGNTLFSAYRNMKKSLQHRSLKLNKNAIESNNQSDLLPPLHPKS